MKKQSETQIKIVEFIKTHPSSSPQSIIDGTGLPNITAYSMLKSLVTDKTIEMKVVDGKKTYTLTGESTQVRPVVETLNTNHVDKKKTAKKFQKTSKRDTSKFKFTDGSIYGKAQLVRVIVHQYVKDHPNTTYAKLKTVFPDELLKSYGVFQTKSAAVKVSKDRPRFFLNDDHLIRLKDKSVIAVTNQVGGEAFTGFLTHARKLGFVVRVV